MQDSVDLQKQLIADNALLRKRLAAAEARLEELSHREACSRSQAQVIDQVHDAVIATDLEGVVEAWNAAAERLYGYTAAEAIGRSVACLYFPEDLVRLEPEVLAPLRRQGAHEVVVRNRRKSGEEVFVELRLTVRHDQAGSPVGLLGCSNDISLRRQAEAALTAVNTHLERRVNTRTASLRLLNKRLRQEVRERRHVEAALRASEVRYRTLVETLPYGIQECDTDGRITFSNRAHAELRGYSEGELLGTFIWDMLASEAEREELRTYLAMLVQEQPSPTPYLTKNLRPDGRVVDVQVDWNYQRDKQGNVTGFISVISDITERKQLEEQLRQAQKMEAIGTLAGGIAHEFNNVLAGIVGFTELAIEDISQACPAHRRLQKVLTASQRAKDLVMQILTFSRKDRPDCRPVRLAAQIAETATLLRATLPSSISLQLHVASDPGSVVADPTHLQQLLLNLCTNAEHAMRETGGVLDIYAEPIEIDETLAASHPDLVVGPYARLAISDTGHGIAAELTERIFEPFFTTKPTGEGAGMGLAIVHGIVTRYGGVILVESAPAKGTTFSIYLPRSDAVSVEGESPGKEAPKGTGCILLVEDEDFLLEMEQEVLKRLGYRVIARTSSLEALGIFRKMAHQIDLVLTDYTMPGLTGEQLARELRAIRADIPIILCSGFSHAMNAEKAEAMGIDAYCMKPLGTRELASTIRRVLKKKNGGL